MISLSKIRVTLFVILSFIITYLYVGYRNVDPEGACKGCNNISRCLEAWAIYSKEFKRLPTDNQMIKHFRNHRQEFEEMAKDADIAERRLYIGSKAIYGYLDSPWWMKKYSYLGLSSFEGVCHIPSDIYTDQEGYYEGIPKNDPNSPIRPFAFAFEMDRTLYIQGEDSWPHNNYSKGYFYFPVAPKVENGLVIGPKKKDGTRVTWRLRNHLDGKWPNNWDRMEYVLLQIDTKWFLYIQKDNMGG